MRRFALLLVAACDQPTTDPPWQLDHDRIVAVRAEPPRIRPGEIARLDALIARAGGSTAIEMPRGATAAFAPGDLFSAVHFYIDHWRVDGPDEARLDVARAELGLPRGAPVPLEVSLQFAEPLYATKTVWLGDSHANPTPPALEHGPVLTVGERYPLVVDVPADWTVRWLTSCGLLEDEQTPRALHIVDEPCDGELVVVVRDPLGGVAWLVLPVRAGS